MLYRENPETAKRRRVLRLFAVNVVAFLTIGLASGLLQGVARVVVMALGAAVLVGAVLRHRRADRLR